MEQVPIDNMNCGKDSEGGRMPAELHAALLEAAGVGIWDYRVTENVLVWDDVMYRLYGVRREDFGGCYEAWRAGVHPDDQERCDREISAALAGGKPFDSEFRVVWADRSVHWMRAYGIIVRDADGNPLRMAGTNWDITVQKQAELAKNEFVSTVSHELRTPLTSISGALGLITGGALGAPPPAMKQMLEIAHKNSMRLSHLINDLLDMEKMLAGKIRFEFQIHKLSALVEQSIDAIRPYGEPLQVGFALQESDSEAQVRVDGVRLQQVLSNFLSNAAKFAPRGSQVDVRLRRVGGSVLVEVIDQGCGIAPEFRGRIFQKFSQADSSDTRQKGGTGLGLAISKEIVERMGGKIGFTSEPGKGSCFFFELPLWREVEAEPECEVGGGASSQARMLVVEDDQDIAHLLALLLRRAGYLVDLALTGEAAMRMLGRQRYAAMTLDLVLPDCNGSELVRRIRANPDTLGLPIVVVSAAVEDGRLSIGGDFSAIDWLSKPIDERRLIAAIRRATASKIRQRPRVLHVEDDPDVCQIIRALGGELADFDVAGSLSHARTRLAAVHYSAVVLDIGLPDGNGLDLLPMLMASNPPPPVIVLSALELSPEQQAQVTKAMVKSRTSNEQFVATLERLIADAQFAHPPLEAGDA